MPAARRPSDAQAYGVPMAPVPVRPLSRAPSPIPMRPISRGPSPAPPGIRSDFQIEKAPKSPGPYGRPNMPQPDGYNRDEQIYRQQVAALIAAKDRQIGASGRIPVGPGHLVLFFRTKNGVSHSLDFPIDMGYTNPPSLDVLIAACKPHPKSDFSNYGDRDVLFFPPNLSLAASVEIANHPILDSIRTSLFPTLPPGNHLFAVKDRLDIVNSGSHLPIQNPAILNNDGRSGTIIVTLPMRFRGGGIAVRDSLGREEKFQGSGGQAGDLDWLAFPADCEYKIETVQKGCCLTLSYGIYLKQFNPTPGTISDALIIPSDGFFDLLAPILNMSRGRSIALYLNYDYAVNPAEVIASSLIPQLKGADLLIYNAFKLHKLAPELHWTAGGYIWPSDRTLEYFDDDITASPPNAQRTPAGGVRIPPFGTPRGPSSPRAARGSFGSIPNDQEFDAIRSRVEASGAASLVDANITVLNDWSNPGVPPVIGRQRVYFVSNGELEKLVVNALVVIYVP